MSENNLPAMSQVAQTFGPLSRRQWIRRAGAGFGTVGLISLLNENGFLEQASAASEAMAEQARGLGNQIGFFQVNP